jgi:hypothetical protein
MTSQRRAIGTPIIALIIIVVITASAIGFVSLAKIALPSSSTEQASTVVSIPNSKVSTITQVPLDCNTGPQPHCIYISGWTVYGNGTLIVQVQNQSPDTVTLANATISGSPANDGYKGSIIVDMHSRALLPDGYASASLTQLPNIKAGDSITVTMTTTVGTHYTKTFQIGNF